MEYRVAESPDGRSTAVIETYQLLTTLDPGVRFVVRTPTYSDSISTEELDPPVRPDSGTAISFAEIVWSSDSRIVAGYAQAYAGERCRWIYDTKERRLRQTREMDDAIRDAIRKHYAAELRAQPDIDPLEWAASREAELAFLERMYGRKVKFGEVSLEASTTPKPFTTRGK
jgi:hypothetical protein